jgi:hypothetical protein
LWSGSQAQSIWQFSAGEGGIITVGPIPMIVHTVQKTTCLAASQPQVLAWAVVPRQPVVNPDSGALVFDSRPGTLTVDVRVQLYDCSANGDPDAGSNPPFSGASVMVQGTGDLAPAAASVSPDPQGRIVYELIGPAVSSTATAVLVATGGGTAVVTATQP